VTVADGFRELGRVDHSDLAFQYYCQDNPSLLPGYIDSCSNNVYASWAEPRRSVIMTDNNDVFLYTISDMGIKAGQVPMPHNMNGEVVPDLSVTLASFLFPPQPYPWWYYGGYIGIVVGGGAVDVVAVSGGAIAVK
jgi:hypothetical protein